MENMIKKITSTLATGVILYGFSTAAIAQNFENRMAVSNNQIDQLLERCVTSTSKQTLHWNLSLQSSFVGLNWLKSSYALQLTAERVMHLDKTISSLPRSFQTVQALGNILTELSLLKQAYRGQAEVMAFNVHNQCSSSLAKQVDKQLKEKYSLISSMYQQYSNTYGLMLKQANAELKVSEFQQQGVQVNMLFNQLDLK